MTTKVRGVPVWLFFFVGVIQLPVMALGFSQGNAAIVFSSTVCLVTMFVLGIQASRRA